MEHMEWAVRTSAINDDVYEGDLQYFGDWEPFAVVDDTILLKKEVLVEDEKSSVHHEMSFEERYDRH